MAEHTLLKDDLLRQIIGVGRVDLLIGAPRIERADEAADLVRWCARAFAPTSRACAPRCCTSIRPTRLTSVARPSLLG